MSIQTTTRRARPSSPVPATTKHPWRSRLYRIDIKLSSLIMERAAPNSCHWIRLEIATFSAPVNPAASNAA